MAAVTSLDISFLPSIICHVTPFRFSASRILIADHTGSEFRFKIVLNATKALEIGEILGSTHVSS